MKQLTDIIEVNKETTLIKPSAILKALTVYTQALALVRPVLQYDSEVGFERFTDILQHQNMFEYMNEDSDYIDFRWSNNKVEEGELDEIIISLTAYSYTPFDTEDQFNTKEYLALSTWVQLGIKGEDYPIEYDISDIAYTVEKYYNLEDK